MPARLKFRPISMAIAASALVAAAGCATGGPSRSAGDPSPHYKIGKPYKINGEWYRPAADPDYDRKGVASWYGADFHGRPTANGEIFDMRQMTAAHTTLPLPSMVEVTNLDNGRRAVVRVNDRGPFAHNRIIDLSRAAARKLGFEHAGLARVRVKFLGLAPLPGQAPPALYAANDDSVDAAPAQPAAPIVAQAPVAEDAAAPANPDPVDGETNQIDIAALIVESDPNPDAPPKAPSLVPAPPLELREYVIQVAVIDDIATLPGIRARLDGEGPLTIARFDEGAETARYRINLGPFASIDAASDGLERVREAGYGSAVIIAQRPS